jgi:outer membrane protein assembly factor BamB
MFRLAVTLTIVSSFIASVGLAFPAVGDEATYVGTMEGRPLQIQAKITDMDSNTNDYSIQIDLSYENSHQVRKEVWNPQRRPMTCEWAKSAIDDCVANGGEIEIIKVKAGTFKTCKTHINDGVTNAVQWIGLVPFLAVKVETLVPVKQNYELYNYKAKTICK